MSEFSGSPRGLWRLLPLVLLIATLLIAPRLMPSPTAQSLAERLTPPLGFGGERMGTDGLGRDMFARLVVGASNSLTVSAIAATGAAVIGVAGGLLAGMAGGWMDRIVSLLVESVLAVPFVTVGLMVTATIGQSTQAMILLLVGTGWVTYARVLRAQARSLSHAAFVEASYSLGAGRGHVTLRHILPNLLPVFLVVYFQQIGAMLLWSASLTWLGIGAPISEISLGGIVRDGQDLLYNGWWVSAFGGLTIVYLVTSLNLAADWLRLSLDPVQKGHPA